MPTEVAAAYVTLIPSARGFGGRLGREIGGDVDREGERQGRRFGGRFQTGFRTNLGGLRFAAFGAVGAVAGVGALIAKTGIQAAAGLEQANISFETLIGNAKQSKLFVSDLQKFAARTPFTMPGLIDASRQLLGVGASAKSVIPTLTAWGDTAGALGLSQDQFNHAMLAMTQSMANGKIQAGDMLQITQAGIPIWSIMGKALGKPVSQVRKLSQEGKLLTADVLPKLQRQMEKDYGGSMARQSQTLAGLWSTLTDTFQQGLAKAILPLEPQLRSALPKATAFTAKALGGLAKLVAAAPRVFRPAVDAVELFIGAFTGRGANVQSYADWINIFIEAGANARGVFDTLAKTFSGVFHALVNFGAVALPLVIEGFHALQTPLRFAGQALTTLVVPALVAATGFLREHGTATRTVVIIVGTFVGVLRAVALAQMLYTKGLLLARGAVLSFRVAMLLANMAMRANPIGLVVTALIALAAGFIYAYKHSATFRAIVQGALRVVEAAAGAVARFFTGPFVGAFQAVGRWLSGNWRKIVVGAALVLTGPFGGAVALIATNWSQTWRIMQRAAGLGVSGIVKGLKFLADVFLATASAIVHGAAHMFGWVPGIGGKLKRAAGAFDTFRASVDGKLAKIAADAEGWGSAVAAGLANGIDASGHLAIGAAQRLAAKVHITVAAALRVQSPSKVMHAIGRFVTQGFVNGILSNLADVPKTMRKLAGLVTAAFGADDPLTKHLAAQSARLQKLATDREGAAKRIAAATQRIAGLRDARSQLSSDVTSGGRDFASLSSVAPLADDGTINGPRLLASLQGVLRTLRLRGAAMRKLSGLKLAPALLKQLWAMDPAASLAYAQAILRDPGLVRGLNGVERQIQDVTAKQGGFAGSSLYDAAIKSAQGLVRGLKDSKPALVKQMRELADTMVKEIRHRLGIHSPSSVFRALMRHVGAGAVLGLRDQKPEVARAMGELVQFPSLRAYDARNTAQLPVAVGADGPQWHVHLDKYADKNVARQLEQAVQVTQMRQRARYRSGRRS